MTPMVCGYLDTEEQACNLVVKMLLMTPVSHVTAPRFDAWRLPPAPADPRRQQGWLE